MNVSAEDTANLVSVQFQEPATNSRTIWGYEIQARDPGFSPPFAASLPFTLGAFATVIASNRVGSFDAGSSVFRVSNSNFAVNSEAGETLYIFDVSQHGYRGGQISVRLSDRIEYVR